MSQQLLGPNLLLKNPLQQRGQEKVMDRNEEVEEEESEEEEEEEEEEKEEWEGDEVKEGG